MAFWGAVVQAGKPTPFVPPPEDYALHLSQASLPPSVLEGTRVALHVLVPDEPPVIVATLCAGRLDSVSLDLFFSEYVEFTVSTSRGASQAAGEVHLAGYLSPHTGEEGYDEGEDEDGDGDGGYGGLGFPMGMLTGWGDDEGDSDTDSEEGESDDEHEEGEDEEFPSLRRSASSVVIEDVTGQEEANAQGGKAPALRQPGKQGAANGAPQAGGEEDDDEDEGGEGDEFETDDEDEEEGEDEDEELVVHDAALAASLGAKRPAAALAPAAAKKQATPAAKREVEAAPTKQQTKQQQQQQQQQPKQQQAKQDQQQQAKLEPKQQQGKQEKKQPAANGATKTEPAAAGGKAKVRRFENGFEIHDLKMGAPDGKLAKAGKQVAVKYVGKLKSNGKVFDKTGPKPFKFRLGVGEVIKGWDRGVVGMRVGDVRRLLIPPQMGYGTQGAGKDIPAKRVARLRGDAGGCQVRGRRVCCSALERERRSGFGGTGRRSGGGVCALGWTDDGGGRRRGVAVQRRAWGVGFSPQHGVQGR